MQDTRHQKAPCPLSRAFSLGQMLAQTGKADSHGGGTKLIPVLFTYPSRDFIASYFIFFETYVMMMFLNVDLR